ncbi:hypothetical protein ANO11243_053710 [Dothideomycetidae sp. 11243]|nr:hypothetical protein ANO11243_053710 [fungal sp. No.11243]
MGGPFAPTQQPSVDASLQHTGSRSLSLIATQAFGLGLALGICFQAAVHLSREEQPLWRLPAFLCSLCVFHFFEFYTTARWNTPAVKASSFLLYSNGWAWHTAHSCAVLEIIITSIIVPGWQARFSPFWIRLLGGSLVLAGQAVRSTAMAQAGTNFNHIPARQKAADHTLVTNGVYAYLRHPSYAGFFWWALGTQLLVGNKMCAMVYAGVLWRFFDSRIRGEERFLNEFFGEEYVEYKKRTGTMIPFIR